MASTMTPSDGPKPATKRKSKAADQPAKTDTFWGTIPKVRGALVAGTGLVALIVIVIAALTQLPAGKGAELGQNVVTIASASFGVIGAIVGAYFGVTASGNARDQVAEVTKAHLAALTQASDGGQDAPDLTDDAAEEVDEASHYGEENPVTGSTDAAVEAAIHDPPLPEEDGKQ